jgi:hypothetical protein
VLVPQKISDNIKMVQAPEKTENLNVYIPKMVGGTEILFSEKWQYLVYGFDFDQIEKIALYRFNCDEFNTRDSLLSERIKREIDEKEVVTDSQARFRKGRDTMDNV